jgi:bacteriocin-like protein
VTKKTRKESIIDSKELTQNELNDISGGSLISNPVQRRLYWWEKPTPTPTPTK